MSRKNRTVSFIIILILAFVPLSMQGQNYKVFDVAVKGNKKLKTSFVQRISTIKKGAILDSIVIENDIKRLKRMPSVSHAYYQVIHSHDDFYSVFYHIEENFTIIPSANIYTSNDGEFAYRLGVYEFNLLGQNIAFGGFYQKDIYHSYGINFRAPHLFTKKFGLAVNHQNLTTLEPVFFNNSSADYKYNNTSYEVLGLYELNFKNRIETGINYFHEDYKYQFGGTSAAVPQQLSVKKLLYKAIYEYNDLDYYYQYLSGFKSMFHFQYVTSTSDDLPEFFIGWNDFFYFTRVGKKGNWANRVRLGLASNSNSPFAPFSVDNNVNIRGVGNTIDRGTAAIVLNSEYRHTLFEKKWFVLQSNVFVDAGTWRNPGGDFGDFSSKDNIRLHPGAGLRFMHKSIYNAVLRIDYGFGVTNNKARGLVFGIGQYF